MKIKGEKTLFGNEIKTPEEFIEDLCIRLNNIWNLVREKNLGEIYLKGALAGLANRLNRVCEKQ